MNNFLHSRLVRYLIRKSKTAFHNVGDKIYIDNKTFMRFQEIGSVRKPNQKNIWGHTDY